MYYEVKNNFNMNIDINQSFFLLKEIRVLNMLQLLHYKIGRKRNLSHVIYN